MSSELRGSYDVFVSYHGQDQLHAINLAQLLKGVFGLRVWIDVREVVPGDSIVRALSTGLNQSRCCVVLIGKDGPGPWQRTEVEQAFAGFITDPTRRVIPILLGGSHDHGHLPAFLRHLSVIDLVADPFGGLERLAGALRGHSTPLFRSSPSDPSQETPSTLPVGFGADVGQMVRLLMGPQLYGNRHVFLRELLQNANDACARRELYLQTHGRSYQPTIDVNITTSQREAVVWDNGDGMTTEILAGPFATIGRSFQQDPRTRSLFKGLEGSDRTTLIGHFGVGFISCFAVAEYVDVSTRAEGSVPVNIRIRAVDEPFVYPLESEPFPIRRTEIGTTVRLVIREGIDFKQVLEQLEDVARHIPGYSLVVDGQPRPGECKCGLERAARTWSYEEPLVFRLKVGAFGQRNWQRTDRNWILLNRGFRIASGIDTIRPKGIPDFLTGEIDLSPSVAALNVARHELLASPDSARVKDRFAERIAQALTDLGGSASERSQRRTKSAHRTETALTADQIEMLWLHFDGLVTDRLSGTKHDEIPISDERLRRYLRDIPAIRVLGETGQHDRQMSVEQIEDYVRQSEVQPLLMVESWDQGAQALAGGLIRTGRVVISVPSSRRDRQGRWVPDRTREILSVVSPDLKTRPLRDLMLEEMGGRTIAGDTLSRRQRSAIEVIREHVDMLVTTRIERPAYTRMRLHREMEYAHLRDDTLPQEHDLEFARSGKFLVYLENAPLVFAWHKALYINCGARDFKALSRPWPFRSSEGALLAHAEHDFHRYVAMGDFSVWRAWRHGVSWRKWRGYRIR